MAVFRVYWPDGSDTDVEGDTVENGLIAAGLGASSLSAADFWEPVYDEEKPVSFGQLIKNEVVRKVGEGEDAVKSAAGE